MSTASPSGRSPIASVQPSKRTRMAENGPHSVSWGRNKLSMPSAAPMALPLSVQRSMSPFSYASATSRPQLFGVFGNCSDNESVTSNVGRGRWFASASPPSTPSPSSGASPLSRTPQHASQAHALASSSMANARTPSPDTKMSFPPATAAVKRSTAMPDDDVSSCGSTADSHTSKMDCLLQAAEMAANGHESVVASVDERKGSSRLFGFGYGGGGQKLYTARYGRVRPRKDSAAYDEAEDSDYEALFEAAAPGPRAYPPFSGWPSADRSTSPPTPPASFSGKRKGSTKTSTPKRRKVRSTDNNDVWSVSKGLLERQERRKTSAKSRRARYLSRKHAQDTVAKTKLMSVDTPSRKPHAVRELTPYESELKASFHSHLQQTSRTQRSAAGEAGLDERDLSAWLLGKAGPVITARVLPALVSFLTGHGVSVPAPPTVAANSSAQAAMYSLSSRGRSGSSKAQAISQRSQASRRPKPAVARKSKAPVLLASGTRLSVSLVARVLRSRQLTQREASREMGADERDLGMYLKGRAKQGSVVLSRIIPQLAQWLDTPMNVKLIASFSTA